MPPADDGRAAEKVLSILSDRSAVLCMTDLPHCLWDVAQIAQNTLSLTTRAAVATHTVPWIVELNEEYATIRGSTEFDLVYLC